MPIIRLETEINATSDVVFDLARSIELHKLSAADNFEEVIAGKTNGLLELNEMVTWRARHFGVYQKLTSKMTALKKPEVFVDEMTKGIFKRFRHEHRFVQEGSTTKMIDIFDYTAPLGLLGRSADWLFLENYLRNFLVKRNEVIKKYAEMQYLD